MLQPLLFRTSPRAATTLLRPVSSPLLRSLPLSRTCLNPTRTLAMRARPSPQIRRPAPTPTELAAQKAKYEAHLHAAQQQQQYQEQEHDDGSEPPEARGGTAFVVIFALITAPIMLINQLPSGMLPPVPDPAHLSHLSKQPLTSSFCLSSPYDALQLFIFRARRGEYRVFMKQNFAYTPLNFMGVSPESVTRERSAKSSVWSWDSKPEEPKTEKFRWWTLGTYMLSHGSIFHWGFCTMALASLVPAIARGYGLARTVGVLGVGGVGSALLDCSLQSYLHGAALREGKGTQVAQVKVMVKDAFGATQEKVVKVLQPAPGMEGVFSAHLGSSGGLMAMFTISALVMPQMKWQLMFIPVGIQSRYMMAGLLAFDVAGAMGVGPLRGSGIGHWGHLGGDVMGVLIYALWLRRLPISRMMKALRKSQGFW